MHDTILEVLVITAGAVFAGLVGLALWYLLTNFIV
jgi:hypothetical protein